MYTALVSQVILGGMRIWKVSLLESEILESFHSWRLSWISKIRAKDERETSKRQLRFHFTVEI